MFGNRKPKESDIRTTLSGLPHIQVDTIAVKNGNVRAIISCEASRAPQVEIAAEQAIKTIKGVKDVQIIVTAETETEKPKEGCGSKPANTQKIQIDAKRIIAVASGKGGVGKSTVAMNIACGLAKAGEKVGLLDADIYGPSVPRMTGLSGQKPTQNADGKIVPLKKIVSSPPPSGDPEMSVGSAEASALLDPACASSDADASARLRDDEVYIDIMSIGFMIGEDNPLIWRGPMVQSAFIQLLQDVAWEGLDTLIIDMPPGTGDVQLTMSQRVPLSGAIIVSTPQDIALIDARKGIEMFNKVDVPIIGLIENMSHYCCPKCGHEDNVFGHGGAKAQAKEVGIPFLGEIPLNANIRATADQGEPSFEFYSDIVKSISCHCER